MKFIKTILIALLLFLAPVLKPERAGAQVPGVSIVTGLVKRVIKAIDLQVQRIQNQTIWLQEAQKSLENDMAKLRLNEIAGWTQKQKDLYAGYYRELQEVKSYFSAYQRIKDLVTRQAALLREYHQTWSLLQQDQHFTAGELGYMQRVYSGILEQSARNLDQVYLLIKSFATQMDDAERLRLINNAATHAGQQYRDLEQFNRENILLSLQRSTDLDDTQTVKNLYGLP